MTGMYNTCKMKSVLCVNFRNVLFELCKLGYE